MADLTFKLELTDQATSMNMRLTQSTGGGKTSAPYDTSGDAFDCKEFLKRYWSLFPSNNGITGPSSPDELEKRLSKDVCIQDRNAWADDLLEIQEANSAYLKDGVLTVLVPAPPPELHALPLELFGWQGYVTPAKIPVIRYTQAEPSRKRPHRALVLDSGLRPLVIVTHQALLSGDNSGTRLRQDLGLESDAPLLIRPSLDEVENILADSQANVLILLSHMTPKAGAASDFAADFDFSEPGAGSGDARPIDPRGLASVVAKFPRVQVVALIACQTWPSAADVFIREGIPAVIGTHWMIGFDADGARMWCRGVHEFLKTLSSDGRLDVAFARMRAAVDDGDAPGIRAASLAMHVYLADDDNLRLVSDDNALCAAIDHARWTSSACAGVKRHAEVRMPGRSSEPNLTKPQAYIDRHLLTQLRRQKKQPRGPEGADDPDSGPRGDEYETIEEPIDITEFIDALVGTPPDREGIVQKGIVAPWGMGKTMLMRWIARELAERFLSNPKRQGAVLPVYIELWRLHGAARGSLERQALRQAAAETIGLDTNSIDDSCALDGNGRRIYLLDGLDEAIAISESIGHALGTNGELGQASTIISARPEALSSGAQAWKHFSQESGNRTTIEPFRPSEARRFIEIYCSDRPRLADQIADGLGLGRGENGSSGSLIHEWTAVPYLLGLVCDIARSDGGPERIRNLETMTEVLLQALPHVLGNRSQDKSVIGGLSEHELIWPLAALAFHVRFEKSIKWCERKEHEWDGVFYDSASGSILKGLADIVNSSPEKRDAEAILGHLATHSGMVRFIPAPGNPRHKVDIHDARYADFLPAIHLARLVQGPWDLNTPDERQGEFPARRCALKNGRVHGWDKPCIEDHIYDESGQIKRERTDSVRNFISRKAWDEVNWGLTIEFLAGLLEDPSHLLNELLCE